MQKRLALGFDMGGTKVEGSVVSEDGVILATVRKTLPRSYAGMKSCVLELYQELTALSPKKPEGLGFGIPGSIDPQSRNLRNAPNNPEIMNTSFFDEVAQEIDVPVLFENDANCLAYSEYKFGVAENLSPVVGIILGSGVGGGVVIDGKIFRGHSGLAPELGHTVLQANGRKCLCGNKGCVEAYLSGASILARYQEAGGVEAKTTQKVFAGADMVAQEVLEETKYLFARFIASLVSTFDPQIFVLGGSVSLQPLFYECDNLIQEHLFGSHKTPVIKKAKHGDASGKLGAAALIFQL